MHFIKAAIYDPRRVLVISLLALAVLVALANCVGAAECQRSAEEVKAAHPGVHPTWSGRVPGHLGQHCWMTQEEKQQVRQVGAQLRQGGERKAAGKDTRRIHQEAGGPARPSSASTSISQPHTTGMASPVPLRWIMADRFEATGQWAVYQDLERGLLLKDAKRRLAEMMR